MECVWIVLTLGQVQLSDKCISKWWWSWVKKRVRFNLCNMVACTRFKSTDKSKAEKEGENISVHEFLSLNNRYQGDRELQRFLLSNIKWISFDERTIETKRLILCPLSQTSMLKYLVGAYSKNKVFFLVYCHEFIIYNNYQAISKTVPPIKIELFN
jgi:hypothetical protein